jgi:hypothetical protein
VFSKAALRASHGGITVTAPALTALPDAVLYFATHAPSGVADVHEIRKVRIARLGTIYVVPGRDGIGLEVPPRRTRRAYGEWPEALSYTLAHGAKTHITSSSGRTFNVVVVPDTNTRVRGTRAPARSATSPCTTAS